MLNLLPATLTENGSCGSSMSTHVMEYNPRFIRGTRETGPQKDSDVLLLLNLNRTLLHFFTLIITAWLHSHHSWTCPRNCSRRSYDHLMRQSSPSRISPVCRRALAKQLVDRMRQASGPHQPVRTTDETVQLPSEPEGLAEPYPTTGRPCSLSIKGKSIFEAGAE